MHSACKCPLSELLSFINIPSQFLGSHYLFLIRSILHLSFVSSASAEDKVFNHITGTQCLSSSLPVTGIKCHCQQWPSDYHSQCQEQEPVPAQIPNKMILCSTDTALLWGIATHWQWIKYLWGRGEKETRQDWKQCLITVQSPSLEHKQQLW